MVSRAKAESAMKWNTRVILNRQELEIILDIFENLPFRKPEEVEVYEYLREVYNREEAYRKDWKR